FAAAALDRGAVRAAPAELVGGDQPHPLVGDAVHRMPQGRFDQPADPADRFRKPPRHAATSSFTVGLARAARAAAMPLRTAPSIVSGQPVAVHAPANQMPGTPES